MRVAVTGAAGQIAYSFIPRLCSGAVFPQTNLHLRLLDITPALKVLKGLILELEDCDFPLVKSVLLLLVRSHTAINLKKCSKRQTWWFSWAVSPENKAWNAKISSKSTKKYSFNKEKLYLMPKKTSNAL